MIMENIKRKAGILLHITSLPSKYGIGTLGKEAYSFVDWLSEANLKVWQVLPLVPTNYGDSPYQSVSSSAYNYYLIDLDILKKKGLLNNNDLENVKFYTDEKKVDYKLLFENRIDILYKAFMNYNIGADFIQYFASKKAHDFAIFMTLKKMHNYKPWYNWADKYKNYSSLLVQEIMKNNLIDYLFWTWTQFEFIDEWNNLHNYAKSKGIEIMGDMPLYVAYDSVEVWKNPEMFILNEDKSPILVAGCPPDAFSDDGQLWGNPVYDWDYLKQNGYSWWNQRIKNAFLLYDIVRIDHFRGFDRFYTIKFGAPNAKEGQWMDGPKFDFFKDKTKLNIVAEDLGVIDDGVRLLMHQTKYPGMKVLEFAFDGDKNNEHKPSNFTKNYVVYTGTHDNMPLYQYINDLDEIALKTLIDDLKTECKLVNINFDTHNIKSICKAIIELAFACKANVCIIPMQDLLFEGKSSRMNLPSTLSPDNWSYRILKRNLSKSLQLSLKNYVETYKR